jgi:hypothetical protein
MGALVLESVESLKDKVGFSRVFLINRTRGEDFEKHPSAAFPTVTETFWELLIQMKGVVSPVLHR